MRLNPKSFQKKILDWFDKNGRKNLPWQQNKTPYRVWISEIMLQQTQVATVMHYWTGLGYYTRAKNIWQSAKRIQEYFSGQFPNNFLDIESLPGIGRSTAGAILSIAFKQAHPILDGNVKRVLTRLMGVREWPGEKKTSEKLWQLSEELTPAERVDEYTQAIMDLGATLCVRGKPACHRCPLQKDCIAHKKGIQKNLPAAKPKKKIPVRETHFLMLQDKDKIFLQKRPPSGIWANLWAFPEFPEKFSTAKIKKWIASTVECEIFKITRLENFRHTFSHFHLDIVPVLISIKRKNKREIMPDFHWYDLKNPAQIGLPAPVKKLLFTWIPRIKRGMTSL